jgi:hypothetical protein
MKMSLNFKFLYNYFTTLFFEFSGSGVSINAINSVLNFYINKYLLLLPLTYGVAHQV